MYIAAPAMNMIASGSEKMPSEIASANRKVEPRSMGRSTRVISYVSFSFLFSMTAVPSTRHMFVMFEPITVAATISVEPLSVANIEAISSGNDVPMLTRVTPIMNGGIPISIPILSAESVK